MTAPRDPSRFLTRTPIARREPPVRRDPGYDDPLPLRWQDLTDPQAWVAGAFLLAVGGAFLWWLFA